MHDLLFLNLGYEVASQTDYPNHFSISSFDFGRAINVSGLYTSLLINSWYSRSEGHLQKKGSWFSPNRPETSLQPL